MRAHRMIKNYIKSLFFITIFTPLMAYASSNAVISLVATTPFPSSVTAGSSTNAVYTVTNTTSSNTFTIVNQTSFPSDSGLSVSANTCSTLGPGASCTITVTLSASTTSDTTHSGYLKVWAKPTATGARALISVTTADPVVTPSAGSNGSINPSSATSVTYNGSLAFTATPDSGYGVLIWQVDGSTVQTGGTTYTLSNITEDKTVAVSFIQVYTVTPSVSGSNGSISPSTPEVINTGDASSTYTATPDSGYGVNIWQVNGSTVQTGGTTYQIPSVTADSALTVSFAQQYTVTPSAGSNGSISPSTAESITSGQSSSTYTATPSSGYFVDQWTENGTPVQTGGSTYQISSVTADTALSVTFKEPASVSVAAGTNSTDSEGFAYYATDPTSSWTLATLPTLPTNSFLNAASCVGGSNTAVCIVAGGVTPGGGGGDPVLYGTQDSGASWDKESPTSEPAAGVYNATACTGETTTAICIAAGRDQVGSPDPAMLSVTADGGTTWTTPTITSNPADGVFNGAACTGTSTTAICVAAGENITDSEPMVAASTDGGSTWTTQTITDAATAGGSLSAASCTGTAGSARCAAVGQNSSSEGLIVQSIDGSAASWAVKLFAGAPATGTLNDVSCIDSGATARCVAVGSDDTNSEPLIVQTSDGGTTWTAVASISGFTDNGTLNGVSCTDTGSTAVCAAGGKDTTSGEPLVVVSTDGGSTWTKVTITSAPASGTLNSMSCTGTTETIVCTAAGESTTDTDAIVVYTEDAIDTSTAWVLATLGSLPTADNTSFNAGSSSGGN